MPASPRRSFLCPACRRLISADLERCPHCGLPHPGAAWRRHPLARLLRDPSQYVRAIIWLNGGMFVLSLLFNPRGAGMSMDPFTFLAPSDRSLLLLGATGTVPIDGLHRWWTLLSANYLHGSILHLLFNMIALNYIGPLILREYGGARLVAIYTISGAAGFLISYLAGIPFTIGASAAVCGLLGAAIYYGKSRGGTYGQAVSSQIGGWAIGIFIFGLLFPGINNWGHGGGMAAGALLGKLLGYRERRRETEGHRLLALGCAAATIVTLLWAVGIAFLAKLAAAPPTMTL